MLVGLISWGLALASQSGAEQPAADDPIVCKSPKEHAVGTRVKRASVCKLKSEWALEEDHAHRQLQKVKDRWTDPGRADGK
jgi:hypothetical protein